MTDDEQLAASVKYGPDVWHFTEIRPNLFALYNASRETVLIGGWDEVLAASLPVFAIRRESPSSPRLISLARQIQSSARSMAI